MCFFEGGIAGFVVPSASPTDICFDVVPWAFGFLPVVFFFGGFILRRPWSFFGRPRSLGPIGPGFRFGRFFRYLLRVPPVFTFSFLRRSFARVPFLNRMTFMSAMMDVRRYALETYVDLLLRIVPVDRIALDLE